MAKSYNVTYEKSALGSFLDELPGLLAQYKMAQSQSALAHERAVELKTMDQVDPRYYEYNDDGSLNVKASMGAQQEAQTWMTQGAMASLDPASGFAYGRDDETSGRYTSEDYNMDKDAISELTNSSTIGYDDAINIINMGLFLDDGDSLMPGGQSVEDMAETMTSEGWWDNNRNEMRKRSNQYFQGVLLNPNFTDQEAYEQYKSNEIAQRQSEIELLKIQPKYTTAKETLNTLMDAEGVWQTRAGLKAVDEDGNVQYYNPQTGKEMDMDDFAKEFSATFQVMTSSQPLDFIMTHYRNGGMNNAVIKQLAKESPSLVQNYILPLEDEYNTVSVYENEMESSLIGLTNFAEPTTLPPELDTALRAFQESQPDDNTGNVGTGPVLAGGPTFQGMGADRISNLRSKGVSAEYIEVMGDSLAQYTDDEVLYANMEYEYTNMYDPMKSETAYEDIYSIQDQDRKDYMVGRLNNQQFAEYDQYVNTALAGVGNVTAAVPSIAQELIDQRTAEYAQERAEFVALNDELKDVYGQRAILSNELNELQSTLDKMIAIEKDEYLEEYGYIATYGDQALSATAEFLTGDYIPAPYENNVTSGNSVIHGNAGKVLFDQIKEKEAALAVIDNQLSREVKTRGGISYWPGDRVVAAQDSRAEAVKAKEALENLIQESLDDLPDIYKTGGGQ
mgnify:CR=1 FL=1